MRAIAMGLSGWLLVACATDPGPGRYPTYRAYAWSIVNLTQYQDLPKKLEEKMRNCTTEAILVGVSPNDYVRLNAYARGEIPESALTQAQINVARELRASPQEPMMRYCPELHQEAEPYRKPT
jgi:hypothetical protein